MSDTRITIRLENGGAGVLGQTQKLAILKLAAYEDLGKAPDELRELLDTNNRQISLYAEENETLRRQLEQLKAERMKLCEEITEIRKAAQAVHTAVVELGGLVNL